MTTPTTRPAKSNPWEMALIHRVIRRGFETAATAVQVPGATARIAPVIDYVEFQLAGLHAHHSTEDELLWPLLRERARLSSALVTRMEEQHVGLHDAIALARAELTEWAANPTDGGAERLAAALQAISAGLDQHLAEEERDVVPVIAEHVTPAEWEKVGKTAFSKFTAKQRFTALGEMLATAHPDEAARMMAGLPVPVRVIWRLFGRRSYERSMAALWGPHVTAIRGR